MKQINGIWWPDEDEECFPVVPGQVKDLDKAIIHCENRRCVVQAGGNVGIWPMRLAEDFGEVWTFEPDEENFRCLKKNITQKNVRFYNAALGEKIATASLERNPKNAGAHYLKQGEDFPVLTIDSLCLPSCDLIVLDIEGPEPLALEGAKETLKKHRPVLMVEDKGLSEKFGFPQGWSETFEGYKVAMKIHRDVVLVAEQD